MTATATDSNGNTSEFSRAVEVSGTPLNVVTNTRDSGPNSLRNAILFANANPGTTIEFNIEVLDFWE